MRRPRKPPEEPDGPPVQATNKLRTVVDPPAADAFMENLLRILDEIEAARKAAHDGPNQKGSSDAA